MQNNSTIRKTAKEQSMHLLEIADMPTMVTIRAAAEQTGLTYSCLRRWILDGKFPFYVRAGSKYLVNLEKLAEFLNSPADQAGGVDKPATEAISGNRRGRL